MDPTKNPPETAERSLKPMAGLVPSKGWLALQPETGALLKGSDFRDLVNTVIRYRNANGLPVEPNVKRQVENQVCMALPEGEAAKRCRFLNPDDGLNPPEMRKWKSGKALLINFGKAVLTVVEETLKGTDVHVSKEEANRRALLCSQCRFNVPLANCWSCGELGSVYRKVRGGLSTKYDNLLQSCDVCACENKTQVHMTGEVLRLVAGSQGITAEPFPAWCWKGELLKEPKT